MSPVLFADTLPGELGLLTFMYCETGDVLIPAVDVLAKNPLEIAGEYPTATYGFTGTGVLCRNGGGLVTVLVTGFFAVSADVSTSSIDLPVAASPCACPIVRHLSIAVLLQSKSEFIPAQPVNREHRIRVNEVFFIVTPWIKFIF